MPPPYIHRAYEIDQGMVVDKAPGAAEEEDFADDEDDKGTLRLHTYTHIHAYGHTYTYYIPYITFVHILFRGLTFIFSDVYDLDNLSFLRQVRGRIVVQPNLGPGEGQAAGLVAPRGCHPDPDRQHGPLR